MSQTKMASGQNLDASSDASLDEVSELSHVLKLGYKVIQQFGSHIEDHLKCTHVLAKDPSGNLLVVEVLPFKTLKAIKIDVANLALVPHSVSLAFEDVISKSKPNVCFLTHLGLDLYNFKKSSLVFTEASREVALLNMGAKFYYPMVFVQAFALTSDSHSDSLAKFVRDTPQIAGYAKLLSASSCPHLLDASPQGSGVWTLFAPTEVNQSGSQKEITSRMLSYIFPGTFGPDYETDAVNLAGDIVKFSKGLPEGASLVAKEVKKVNGSAIIVKMKVPLEASRHIDLNFVCPPASYISHQDVMKASQDIMRAQKTQNVKIKAELKEKLEVLMRASSGLPDTDMKTSSQLSAINHALSQLAKMGRDL